MFIWKKLSHQSETSHDGVMNISPDLYDEKILLTNHSQSQYRSSHRRCSMWKGVHRNFAKLTEKHLCHSLFFNKVPGLLKKRLSHRCFPANFVKFLRTPFLQKTSGRLLSPVGLHAKALICRIFLIVYRILYVNNMV